MQKFVHAERSGYLIALHVHVIAQIQPYFHAICRQQYGKSSQVYLQIMEAGPNSNLGVSGSNPGQDGYLSSWLCIYSAPDCSKAWSVQCCL